MKLNRRSFIGSSVVAAGALFVPRSFATPLSGEAKATLPASPASTNPPHIIGEALSALDRHAAHLPNRDRLGIADFSASSGEFRFHVVDVAAGRVEQSLLVSHGKGSDPGNSGYARHFSNRPGSHASSLGSFATGDIYYGKHGRSRRLHGLDDENSLAFERAIVIHGASYVDRTMARQRGRIGRSFGCFAFEKRKIDEVLEVLGPGRLLYAAS